jgi:hypothetical protein
MRPLQGHVVSILDEWKRVRPILLLKLPDEPSGSIFRCQRSAARGILTSSLKSRASSCAQESWEEGKQSPKEAERAEEESVDEVEGGKEEGEDEWGSVYRLVLGLRIDSGGGLRGKLGRPNLLE